MYETKPARKRLNILSPSEYIFEHVPQCDLNTGGESLEPTVAAI